MSALYFVGGALSATEAAAQKTLPQTCVSLTLRNDGANAVHLNLNSATVAASTSYFSLLAGGTLSLRCELAGKGVDSFSYICAAGLTSTLSYAALRG